MAMTRWERKAALAYGATAEIADKLELTRGHVSQVVNGKRRDRRVEVAVARKVGRPVRDVFPALEQEA